MDEALSQLAAVWSPAGVALAPEAFTALARVDVPAVLARSLRAGLVAELSWPAYEQVAEDKLGRRYGDGWPQLVVQDNRTAHVVDVNGLISEHIFRYPPSDSPHAQLLLRHQLSAGRWAAPGHLVQHQRPACRLLVRRPGRAG
ncbi:hypothetical protein V2I01_29705 [Micromonospora sp. BRA006-A]|nr:hypothetical protein [Micromonospora sp. BRA006-A]